MPQKIAMKLREKAPAMTETYFAYGACENLFKECSTQADYWVPQAEQKGAEIPMTGEGIHIGVGEGWWYECKAFLPVTHPRYHRKTNTQSQRSD